MWCTNCRQDVPGIASQAEAGPSSGGPLVCIRCGTIFLAKNGRSTSAGLAASPGATLAAASEPDADSAPADLPAAFDSWELEERLRHVKRLLAPPPVRESRSAASNLEFRIDAGSTSERRSEASQAAARNEAPVEQAGRGAWASLAAWSAIAIGLAALTCGGVLCGWSLAQGRDELWAIGLPLLLGGQMTLLIGLLLQLRRIWRDSSIRNRPTKTVKVRPRPARELDGKSV
jgi:hypothetical protein